MGRIDYRDALENPDVGSYPYKLLGILASGTNPDGTVFTLPVEVQNIDAVTVEDVSVNNLGTIETTLSQMRRSLTDYETRLDYSTRTDSNPVYVGKALQGTATSAAEWTVQLLTYDTSDRLTRVQVRTGVAWDSRTSGWS